MTSAVLGIAFFAALFFALAKLDRNGQWRRHEPFFPRKAVCIDGIVRDGVLMRRMIKGKWQYRPESQDETLEHVAEKSW